MFSGTSTEYLGERELDFNNTSRYNWGAGVDKTMPTTSRDQFRRVSCNTKITPKSTHLYIASNLGDTKLV